MDRLPLSLLESGAGKLAPAMRAKVNAALLKAGLDGNGRFAKAERGYAKALDVLQRFGIELGEVVNAGRFRRDADTLNVDISFSNPDDAFSPADITNSMLAIQYTKLRSNSFEVVAYLS